AISKESAQKIEILKKRKEEAGDDKELSKKINTELKEYKTKVIGNSLQLAKELEQLTLTESRVTILGHLQRGGIPSAADRLLATRLGTACAQYINEDMYGVMVAAKNDGVQAVPLQDIVGKRKMVPLDHPWIECARNVGTSMGDI
ncbi:MAG: 6-phosphofructokinase, partial [Bacteroidales bacterium]|nr:6-phosphofructokinase [Bacteroidales bacterium]